MKEIVTAKTIKLRQSMITRFVPKTQKEISYQDSIIWFCRKTILKKKIL